MLNLYQEILMDHYRNPRNNGTIDQCNFRVEQRNSSCGDEVICMGVIKNNVLKEVAFQGKGCVISQATSSILSEFVKNTSLDAILTLNKDDLMTMIGMQPWPF